LLLTSVAVAAAVIRGFCPYTLWVQLAASEKWGGSFYQKCCSWLKTHHKPFGGPALLRSGGRRR